MTWLIFHLTVSLFQLMRTVLHEIIHFNEIGGARYSWNFGWNWIIWSEPKLITAKFRCVFHTICRCGYFLFWIWDINTGGNNTHCKTVLTRRYGHISCSIFPYHDYIHSITVTTSHEMCIIFPKESILIFLALSSYRNVVYSCIYIHVCKTYACTFLWQPTVCPL